MTLLEIVLAGIIAFLLYVIRSRHVPLSERRYLRHSQGQDEQTRCSGSLHVRCGPMFCGKTTWLLEEITRSVDLFDRAALLINSVKDTRSNDPITSHSSQFKGLSSKIVGLKTKRLADVDVTKFSVIGVDEAQFYPDLADTVRRWVSQGKQVYCAGLDGDFEMKLFGQINQLLAPSDSFMKMTAICDKCLQLAPRPVTLTNLTRAPFTVRLVGSTEQVDAGGADKYVASCRSHFSVYGK